MEACLAMPVHGAVGVGVAEKQPMTGLELLTWLARQECRTMPGL